MSDFLVPVLTSMLLRRERPFPRRFKGGTTFFFQVLVTITISLGHRVTSVSCFVCSLTVLWKTETGWVSSVVISHANFNVCSWWGLSLFDPEHGRRTIIWRFVLVRVLVRWAQKSVISCVSFRFVRRLGHTDVRCFHWVCIICSWHLRRAACWDRRVASSLFSYLEVLSLSLFGKSVRWGRNCILTSTFLRHVWYGEEETGEMIIRICPAIWMDFGLSEYVQDLSHARMRHMVHINILSSSTLLVSPFGGGRHRYMIWKWFRRSRHRRKRLGFKDPTPTRHCFVVGKIRKAYRAVLFGQTAANLTAP